MSSMNLLRSAVLVLPMGCLMAVSVGAEDPPSGSNEFLAVNLSPGRICLVAVDGTVSVAADVPSTRWEWIGLDGRAFAFNRSHAGRLEVCQLLPRKVACSDELETIYEAKALKSYHVWELRPAPQGDLIAMSMVRNDPDRPPYDTREIYLLEPSRQRLIALTRFDNKFGRAPLLPRWSPDGNKLAFYYAPDSAAPGPPDARLALNVVTIQGEVRKLADETHISTFYSDYFVGPVWSTDSETVFFVGHRDSEDPSVPRGYPVTYAARLIDGDIRRIGIGNPYSVTPDGRFLFCSAPSPPDKVRQPLQRRVDLRTGEYEELGSDWYKPDVSPSGRYVACSLGSKIVIFTMNGKELARIDMEEHELLKPGTGIVSWVAFK